MRKPKTIGFWEGKLPHWEVEEGRYFVTLHVAGAIPNEGRVRIRAIAEQLRQETRETPDWLRLHRAIFGEMERWLDRAEWNAHLRRRDLAEIAAEAIAHRQERGDWQMHAYVVMPTHLHLFCEVGHGGLREVMEDFKRWTAHQAAPLLSEAEKSRPGSGVWRLWQREWFDHWSRSDEEDDRIMAYIRANPAKASLGREWNDWPYMK